MQEWITRLRKGEVEVLVDVLDVYGAGLQSAMAGRTEEKQIESIEQALRGLYKHAGRYKGGDPDKFVIATLARFAKVDSSAITVGGSLERRVKMQVMQRLARVEAKTGRRHSKLHFVGMVAMVLIIVIGMVFVVGKSSSQSKLAAAHMGRMPGSYEAVYHAQEAHAWVLLSEENSDRTLTLIAQPGHEQEPGQEVAKLPLPSGDILGILSDGTAVIDDGKVLQRVGPRGVAWSLRRPTGTVQVLDNGMIVCFDRWPLDPDMPIRDIQGTGKVTVLDYNGARTGQTAYLPIKDSVTFFPAGADWVAATNGVPTVVYDSSGQELTRYSTPTIYEQSYIDVETSQVVVATRTGDVEAHNYAWDVLWKQSPGIASMRDNGFAPRLIPIPGLEDSLMFAFDATGGYYRQQNNSTLAVISKDGKLAWKRDYKSGGPGNPVFISEDGSIILHTVAGFPSSDYMQVCRASDGKILARVYNVNLRWGDCDDAVSAVVDEQGQAWVMVVEGSGSVSIYRTTNTR